jgi:hypothetical protein
VARTITGLEVCQEVGSIYETYLREFDGFRYGPSDVPWQVFYDLSDRATRGLMSVADQIDAYGINWDSSAIVSSLIYSSADTIDKIKYYIQNNQFPIGSDLPALQQRIYVNLNSVLNSACR